MIRDGIRLCGLALVALTACGVAYAGRAGTRPKVQPKEEEEEKPPEEKVEAPAPKPKREEAAPRDPVKKQLWRLSKEASQTDRLRASEAEALYEQALAAYENLRYEKAKKLFEQALQVWPDHEDARVMLGNTKALLGYRRDMLMKAMSDLTKEKKIKMQQALIEIKNVLDDARGYYNDAHVPQIGDEERETDAILARQIKDLDEAITRYNRALEVIRWLPYDINLTEYKGLALEMRNTATDERMRRLDDLKSYQTQHAVLKAEERKREEKRFYRDRIEKLFEQAKRYFEYKQYESCEKMCKEILKIDRTNKEAESLIYTARRAKHELFDWRTYTDTAHHRKAMKMRVAEAAIPYARTIVYPKHWDKIVERTETATAIGMAQERSWEKEIERALDKKVSFEFVETPLSEAVSFLQTLTKVNMILDPKATEGRETPINLKVSNMSLKLALDWILKLADLDYALRDDAIFVSTPEELSEDVLLRMYDVRDLTQIIKDFPGPDFDLMFGGTQAGGAGSSIVITTEPEMDAVTASSLAEMIQSRVKPDSWAAELGTSIEERGGKLVVMQRPEIHKLIGRLLESFRATQKLLVTVEARFLEISERFWEEIGWQWGGLDTESGSAPNPPVNPLSTGAISSQTLLDPELSTPGQVDTGLVFDGQDMGGGDMLYVVGAIHTGGIGDSATMNSRPRSSPEDTELGMLMDPVGYTSIGGRQLRQGLNAQVTYLGKMEAMGFLHALKVREAGTILTAPRLTVYNTQRAHMFVATQRSYVADYEVSGDMYDPVIRQFLMGVVLDVKPIVSSDRRYITVELRPTTAELVDMQDLTIQAVRIVGDPPFPITEYLPIQFPIIELRKVRTTVTIPDGGIIMIGGMMENINYRATTGVPFLSHLPIVGKLFRWDLEDKEQSSLSVLLTARLLIFEEEERKL